VSQVWGTRVRACCETLISRVCPPKACASKPAPRHRQKKTSSLAIIVHIALPRQYPCQQSSTSLGPRTINPASNKTALKLALVHWPSCGGIVINRMTACAVCAGQEASRSLCVRHNRRTDDDGGEDAGLELSADNQMLGLQRRDPDIHDGRSHVLERFAPWGI